MDDYLATTSATFTTGARHEFHGPFSLAQARAAGMTEREWRDRALVRATRGVRAPREAHTLQERARVMALAIPEPFAFSHSTAARLWGLPLPAPYEDELTMHVLRGRAIERLGCTGHAGLPSRQTALVRGLPVTSLADTWVDLGELAEPALTRDDLVVIGDAIALALDRALAPVDEDDDAAWADYVAARYDAEQATWSRRAAVGMDAEPAGVTTMREARDRRVRPRGAVLLDSALERVRPRVRSPQETRTRLMFVAAGLPEPETGAQIGTHSGWWGGVRLGLAAPEGCRRIPGRSAWHPRLASIGPRQVPARRRRRVAGVRSLCPRPSTGRPPSRTARPHRPGAQRAWLTLGARRRSSPVEFGKHADDGTAHSACFPNSTKATRRRSGS